MQQIAKSPILITLILAGLFMFCQGIGLSMVVNQPTNHVATTSTSEAHHSSICCAILGHSVIDMNSEWSVTAPQFIALSIIILVMTWFGRTTSDVLSNRWRILLHHLKTNFGNTKIFSQLLQILRKGILHPKLF